MSTDDKCEKPIKYIYPPAKDLGVIINEVRCEECNLVFYNESRFRMHDLKVHKRKHLEKICKENVRYKCPVNDCIYAANRQKSFTLYKYLKQHYLKVHADKNFICTCCTKSFSTDAAKKAHIRVCGTNFICECQKIFNSLEALLTHGKRNSHKIDEKYRFKKSKKATIENNNTPHKFSRILIATKSIQSSKNSNIFILPKPMCDTAVQTEKSEVINTLDIFKIKSSKSHVCRYTQTSDCPKEKQTKKSTETQTVKAIPRVIRVRQVGKRKKISIDKNFISKEDINIVQSLSSEYLLPDSPLSLRHDIILQDLWEEKSTSGTQTSPEKNIFGDTEDFSMQHSEYQGISRSDPMLTEEFVNRYSSIETQTEKGYCKSLFEADPMSSNNETQTTENFTETMEFNNTYTQTCDEILSSDIVGLSDIQTQTAWTHLDETTVSTETQTKALKCISGCNDSNSWFATQMNHMETQTDLLNMFDVLT
ncbi:uncharacterized protein LOC131670294 [Phymastichus coffea]|uniref:uncharacterized protein LOC131670294 n=1 Tax=Phymastichus coffea TaxID=108790 RepID=UPI00273ADD9B|nr:uncharacterized protein LOC131670294 [Phymastichus coffea]